MDTNKHGFLFRFVLNKHQKMRKVSAYTNFDLILHFQDNPISNQEI